MKSLYYRTQKISNRALIWIAAITLLALLMLRQWPVRTSEWERERMLEAAYRTEAAFNAIACRRVDRGQQMLRSQDPNETGMLGPSMSLVTTLPGHLDAKLTSINPNFAAVAVRLLLDAGVQPGDCVAIGMTGSFPALNIAVLQACESLDLRPLVVSSAASSQYGANDPGMMWPDMEKILYDEGLINERSLLTSPGGFRDAAAGMTDDTQKLLRNAIDRNHARLLRCETLEESIDKRMEAFFRSAENEPIKAYINVGGGAASVGGTEGNDIWGSGYISPAVMDSMDEQVDCVATRFLSRGVPLINMVHSVALAQRYKLVIAGATPPVVGEGTVYESAAYRRWLALLGIVMVLGTTWLAVKPPVAFTKLLQRSRSWSEQNEKPQWMV
jgi:poly-gamma-glutamate system protein